MKRRIGKAEEEEGEGSEGQEVKKGMGEKEREVEREPVQLSRREGGREQSKASKRHDIKDELLWGGWRAGKWTHFLSFKE